MDRKMPGTVNQTQSLDWHRTLCEFDFRTNQTQCNKSKCTEPSPLDCVQLGSVSKLSWTQSWPVDCVWLFLGSKFNKDYVVSKTQKNEMYWSNSNLKKLAIDFPPHFYKKQEFRIQNFDLVWLSNYAPINVKPAGERRSIGRDFDIFQKIAVKFPTPG